MCTLMATKVYTLEAVKEGSKKGGKKARNVQSKYSGDLTPSFQLSRRTPRGYRSNNFI